MWLDNDKLMFKKLKLKKKNQLSSGFNDKTANIVHNDHSLNILKH